MLLDHALGELGDVGLVKVVRRPEIGLLDVEKLLVAVDLGAQVFPVAVRAGVAWRSFSTARTARLRRGSA